MTNNLPTLNVSSKLLSSHRLAFQIQAINYRVIKMDSMSFSVTDKRCHRTPLPLGTKSFRQCPLKSTINMVHESDSIWAIEMICSA